VIIMPEQVSDRAGVPNHWDVGVAIPAIPPRVGNGLLERALRSVWSQELQPAQVSVAVDLHREGAPPTRQRALDGITTPLVAFLDDDDEFEPQHLAHLVAHLRETGADLVYSWFRVVASGVTYEDDPVFPPTHFTESFDPLNPIEVTSMVLVRTELAKLVGFRRDPDRQRNTGEDWGFLQGVLAHGGRVSHLVEKTWRWHHDSHNTSGLPDRW
jgi:hypothetical protein